MNASEVSQVLVSLSGAVVTDEQTASNDSIGAQHNVVTTEDGSIVTSSDNIVTSSHSIDGAAEGGSDMVTAVIVASS